MVSLVEKKSDKLSDVFADMPSLGQIKVDIHKYLIKLDSDKSRKLEDVIEDKSYTKSSGKVDEPKYFKGNVFTIGDNRGHSLKITIKLNIASQYTSSINFKIDANLKLKDAGSKLTRLLYTKDVDLVDFMDNWTNHDWRNLFNSAIDSFADQLKIKDNESEDNLDDVSTLDKFLTKLNRENKTEFKRVEDLAKDIQIVTNYAYNGGISEIVRRLTRAYSDTDSVRSEFEKAIISRDAESYSELLANT